MTPQFQITTDTPMVIRADGCVEIWDTANQTYFSCSKEFWNDVNDMIQHPSKYKSNVIEK